MLNEVTVSKYVDAITAEAQEAKLEAEKKIAEYKNSQISRFKAETLENSKSEVSRRCAVIREDIGREFSVKETKLREQIFTKRDEIKTDVFNRAKNKLIEFTKSDDYKAFVVNSAAEIKKNLVGRDKAITVYLRECDMALKNDIEQAFAFPCVFVIDDKIEIGGIRAKFSSVIIDDTIDARLNSQVDWFEENSGLDI